MEITLLPRPSTVLELPSPPKEPDQLVPLITLTDQPDAVSLAELLFVDAATSFGNAVPCEVAVKSVVLLSCVPTIAPIIIRSKNTPIIAPTIFFKIPTLSPLI